MNGRDSIARTRLMLCFVSVVALAYFSGCTDGESALGDPGASSLDGLDDTLENYNLENYNLVLINIDTLRADHLGSYGYRRDTSPFLDRLASEGILFERARANSSFTRESVAVLMTGRLPTSGGSLGWNAKPSVKADVLGELLQGAGYRTGFFSNTVMLTDPGFTRGFDEVRHLSANWGISQAGPLLTASAIDFVQRHSHQKFALYLHYLDPHGPYQPPEANQRRFTDNPFEHPVGLYRTVRRDVKRLIASHFGPGDPRFEDLVLRYDAEISHTDASIEALFSAVAKLGLLEHTVFVVTADHGEEFLEHGFVEHGWTLYEESLRVPLILWAPSAFAPRRVATPISTADVLPTLMELLKIPYDREALDGRPLFATPAASSDRPLIAELLIREQNMLRTVVWNGWKYTAFYRWLDPAQRSLAATAGDILRKRGYETKQDPWPPVIREELYHLPDDPGEQRDLAKTAPDALERLRVALDAYRERCETRGLSPAAPDTDSPLTELDEQRLRALGYL
jgi:arylsulfatase A-like enzyme